MSGRAAEQARALDAIGQNLRGIGTSERGIALAQRAFKDLVDAYEAEQVDRQDMTNVLLLVPPLIVAGMLDDLDAAARRVRAEHFAARVATAWRACFAPPWAELEPAGRG